jgi:hypothetical protein
VEQSLDRGTLIEGVIDDNLEIAANAFREATQVNDPGRGAYYLEKAKVAALVDIAESLRTIAGLADLEIKRVK